MTHLSHGGIFRLLMIECDQLKELQDFVDVIGSGSKRYEFVILGESLRQGEEVGRKALGPGELLDFIQFKYQQSKKRIAKIRRESDPIAQVSINIRPAFISKSKVFIPFHDDLFLTMVYTEYSQKPGAFTITFPFSRRNMKEEDKETIIEPLIQFYVDYVSDLIPKLDPKHCWISEIDEYLPKIEKDVDVSPPINIIFWANYFSREYAGDDFSKLLLNAPSGKSSEKENGIWYQLHNDFEIVDNELMVEIINETNKYFSTYGIEYVFWRKA